MRNYVWFGTAFVALALAVSSFGQSKAAVQIEKEKATIHPGDSITFKIKLNEPLPKGAHFDFRITPGSVDQEIDLGSGESTDGSSTEFRVAGKLPENAVPGEWRISVIYLFLQGANWTHNTIKPNDLKFKVEGNPFPIPTQADVSLEH